MAEKQEIVINLPQRKGKAKVQRAKQNQQFRSSNSGGKKAKLDKVQVKKIMAAARPSLVQGLGSLNPTIKDAIVRKYVAHVIDPSTPPTGVPMQAIGNVKTGLVQSTLSCDISANFSDPTPGNSGRFAIVASPLMGDGSKPAAYKAAIVDSGGVAGWPSDFSATASFLRVSGDTTLTVDPNFSTLLQPSPMYFSSNGNNVAPPSNAPYGSGAVGAYTVSPTTSDLYNTNLGAANILKFFGTTPNVPVDANFLKLPPGQYLLNTEFVLSAAQAALQFQITASGPGCQVSQEYYGHEPAGLLIDGGYILTVYNNEDHFLINWNVVPTVTYSFEIELTSSWARPDQLASPATAYPLNGGLINQYVPVAMSALFTPLLPKLYEGGEVIGGLVPPETCERAIFVDVPDVRSGNPLYSEKLRQMTSVPRYPGRFEEGSYVIWKPNGPDQMTLRSPQENQAMSWPCIVIAGHVNLGAGGVGVMTVGRLLLTTTYQFTAMTTMFPMENRIGSTDAMENAMRLLLSYPVASGNPEHLERIKKFLSSIGAGLKKVYGFYESNKAAINPALALAASFI